MLKKIVLVVIMISLYSLPAFLFKPDYEYYFCLNLPKYALENSVFSLAWVSVYILLSLFIVLYFNKSNFDKTAAILLVINYFVMFFFNKTFFINHKLYWSFAIYLMAFVSVLLVYLNALVNNRKISTLLVPYLLWTLFLTVLHAHIFLIN